MSNYINLQNSCKYESLNSPAEIVRQGGIIVFPTETVYGIGVNALDEIAVKRLFDVKKRPYNKPISLLVSSIDMVNEIAKDITDLEYTLMNKFFPGPLTIILNKKDVISDVVTSGQNTVGVRMPDNSIARKLIEYAGVPLATSSANISNEPSATNVSSLMEVFAENVDCFVDGGESNIGVASTIVKVIDGKVNILRQGPITKEDLEKVLKKTV